MAMEDAIALAASVDAHPDDLETALVDYEATRKPQVARIQEAARQGLSWWETFGRTYDNLPPWQFAYHFFTRSLPESKLRVRDEAFVDGTHKRWYAEHDAEPLDSTFTLAGTEIPERIVSVDETAVHLNTASLPLLDRPPRGGGWAARVEVPVDHADLWQAYARVSDSVAAGANLVAVQGGTPLHRRLVCEEARLGHATPALLIEDATDDVATTAILSGRTDLVTKPQATP